LYTYNSELYVRYNRIITVSINQSINHNLSEQMQKHCSHCTSIWGDITCREM